MAGIDKLYLKYRNRVQRYLEEDPYYQYLLELIAAGRPTITQFNRVLDKSIDEKWLEAIEEVIPAIHEIIAHPRRFLKTVEELKPVEKVSKISTSTVQHLASHTQYISGMRGGTIFPGKLLTIESDESIDLYENRFVATLIRKLGEFLEKRTGALFWDSGDEQTSVLRMESTVEDDYELIEYKLDMTVHNKQTYLENDTGKLEVFKRIDRVRRVLTDFKQSAFMAEMGQCAPVKSPVQRTNQIIKNPDYRKCYDLWQFLERYDQVGYSIDVRETALDFDEDYLFQMYGNLAMGYTVFKSLLEGDLRRITEPPKRRKSIKPKFVKQIVEEFVDDYDLPDVEIRRVIIEEVTKAQAEIERRTKELKAQKPVSADKEKEKERLAKEKEKEREKARLAKEKEREKAKAAAQKAKEQEKAKLAKQKELEKARLAKEREREKARLAKQKEKEREKIRLAKEKEREKAKAAAAKEREKAAAQKAKEQEKAKAAAQKAKAQEKAKSAATKTKKQEKPEAEKAKTPSQKPRKAAAPKPKAPKPVLPLTVEPISTPEPIPEPVAVASAEAALVPEIISPPKSEPLPTPDVTFQPVSQPDFLELLTEVPSPAPAEPESTSEPIAEPLPEPTPAPKPKLEFPSNPLTDWIRRRRERDRK